MIAKVHKTAKVAGASNKGSASNLVDYLEKEKSSLEGGYFFGRGQKEDFRRDITRTEATLHIDNNTSRLGKKDTKFFMVTLNFSDREQAHILKNITGRKINQIEDLSPKEKQLYERKLQDFTKAAMQNYAENFGRGISEKDLVYVAKIEHNRHYRGNDEKVKLGEVKAGDKKKGLNTHVHIIVSRKDQSQKLKLSPNAIERAARSGHKVNGKDGVIKGFNHETFKLKTERTFDKQFSYSRTYDESYASKSKNEVLEDVTRMYKNSLTPIEYKQLAALSDQNREMVYKYFTNPTSMLQEKIKESFTNQLNLKQRIKDQIVR